VLGRGGFGTVYDAHRNADGLRTAIKVARRDKPGAGEQLLSEVNALRAVGSPHAPTVYDFGQLRDGTKFAALEYIAAPTLAQRLSRGEAAMPLPHFGALAQTILAAVETVHSRGLIHCDLKPENIFIEESPSFARLVDFGLVQRPRGSASGTMPEDETILGTPDYMSPEQCRSGSLVCVGTDIYSLGVIFYELLTGHVPFYGRPADVREGHRSKRPPRLYAGTQVTSAMEEVVLRCLAKNPQERFADVASLGEALNRALAIRVHTAVPKPEKSAPARAREKRAVGLLFFFSPSDAAAVQQALESFGGHLAHAASSSCVGVFGHESGDNPAARALLAARGLVRDGLIERAIVDLATVTVQERASGRCHYFSPQFTRSDNYPAPSDPEGIFLTDKAAKVLTHLSRGSLQEHRGMFRLLSSGDDGTDPSVKDMGPLVGREDVLESLLRSARTAMNARAPTIATVIAELGHGKTHLCAALLDELRTLPGVQLLFLGAREPAGGDADQTVGELLSKLLLIPSGERPSDAGRSLLVDRLGAELAKEVWAGVALTLDWTPSDAPEVRPFAAAPGALRSAVARAAGAAMRGWAQSAPLLFVLDDGQLADETTLDAIEYATLAEGHAPIWVCVLARPAFETARPSWAERSARRDFTRLGPLRQDAASTLCRALLSPAGDVPAAAIQILVERTHGIPLQMVELVRGLKSRGLIRQNVRTGTWYLATEELDILPDLPIVEWLAARELNALPVDLASHARLAALLGTEFSPEEIKGVLGELERQGEAGAFPLDASVGTERLVSKGVLLPRRRGQLSFRHALVRDAVYKSVPESMRQPIHYAAFRFYRDGCVLPEHQRLSRLAFHAAQVGLRDVASDSFLTLAQHAQSRHAYLEAESMYGQALEQMGSDADARRFSALRGRGLMRYRLGRYGDACQDFDSARQWAHQLGDSAAEVEILLDEATALDWAEEYRKSRELVNQANEIAGDRRTLLIEARLLMGLGRSCMRFNHDEEAAELYIKAADKSEPLGDTGYETYVISLLLSGYVLATLGRLEEAERAFERVIPMCESRGDKLHLGAAVANRFMLWTCRNDKERLIADLQRLLAISREMGNGRMEQQAHFYLGLYLRWLNEFEEAEKHARRAVEIDKRRLGEAARPESALLLARVLAASGKAAEARGILDHVRERQSRARARDDREFELLPSEEVFYAMVDLATQDAREREWEALRAQASSCLTGQDLIEVLEMRARAAQRQGLHDVARQAFQDALEVAERVPNVMRSRIERELDALRSA